MTERIITFKINKEEDEITISSGEKTKTYTGGVAKAIAIYLAEIIKMATISDRMDDGTIPAAKYRETQ